VDRARVALPRCRVSADEEGLAGLEVPRAGLEVHHLPALVDRVLSPAGLPILVGLLGHKAQDDPLKLVVVPVVQVEVNRDRVAVDHVAEDLRGQVGGVPHEKEPPVDVSHALPGQGENVVVPAAVVRRGAVIVVARRRVVVVRGVVLVAGRGLRVGVAGVRVVGVDAVGGEPPDRHVRAVRLVGAVLGVGALLVVAQVHPSLGAVARPGADHVAIGVEEAGEPTVFFAGVVGDDLAAREGGQEEGHEGQGQVAHLDLPWGLAPPAFARPLGTVALSGRWWSLGTQRPSVSGFLCQNLSTSK